MRSSYLFGFNGQENDNEVKGAGNSLDFGARIYDSRLGRWLALDPLMAQYPGVSPYVFCQNNTNYFVDKDGRDIWVAVQATGDRSNQDAAGHVVIVKTTYQKVMLEIDGKVKEMYKITGYEIIDNYPHNQSSTSYKYNDINKRPPVVGENYESIKDYNGVILVNSDIQTKGSDLNVTKENADFDPNSFYVTPSQINEESLLDEEFKKLTSPKSKDNPSGGRQNTFDLAGYNCTAFVSEMLTAIGIYASGTVDKKTGEKTRVNNPNTLFQNLKKSMFKVIKEEGDLSTNAAIKYIEKSK